MKSILSVAAAALCLAAVAAPARAAYVIDLREVGADIDATGSGSLDLTGLTALGLIHAFDDLNGGEAQAVVGAFPATSRLDGYRGLAGPTTFGGPFPQDSSSGSGTFVLVNGSGGLLAVTPGYVSGTPAGLSTAVFSNNSFASLHLTPGTYAWTWGQGEHADNLTLNIGVPEPATWAMLILGIAAIGAVARGRRRTAAA